MIIVNYILDFLKNNIATLFEDNAPVELREHYCTINRNYDRIKKRKRGSGYATNHFRKEESGKQRRQAGTHEAPKAEILHCDALPSEEHRRRPPCVRQ